MIRSYFPRCNSMAPLAALGALLCLHPLAGAQNPPPPSVENTGRIQLDISVIDASAKPVRGLTAQDFTLLDNNHPRPIVSFQAFDAVTSKPDPPVEMILLIDELNNNFVDLSLVRQGLSKFLRQGNGHLALPTSLLVLTN